MLSKLQCEWQLVSNTLRTIFESSSSNFKPASARHWWSEELTCHMSQLQEVLAFSKINASGLQQSCRSPINCSDERASKTWKVVQRPLADAMILIPKAAQHTAAFIATISLSAAVFPTSFKHSLMDSEELCCKHFTGPSVADIQRKIPTHACTWRY